MEPHHVSLESLTVGTVGAKVRVRVGRIWDSVNLKTGDVYGLNMQLLDNMGGEIHAEIKPRILQFFYGKFKESSIYDISDFTVSIANNSYLTVHNSCKIDFTSSTTYVELEDADEDIPFHKFSFTDYKTIVIRSNAFKLLSDVIGILHSVEDVVTQSTINNPTTKKREIIIFLECGTLIPVTLWDIKTTMIDQSTMDDNLHTVILTSLTVKTYRGKQTLGTTTATTVYIDLDIGESTELLKIYRKKKLPSFVPDEKRPEKQNDLISGKNLSYILINAQKDQIFEFEAKITDINLTNGWEYISCNVCKRGVGNSGPSYFYDKCAKPTEFPLHRYRLELIVDDGTATASVVLFDNVAEFLIKHKAESLIHMQRSEVAGDQKVKSIIQQPVGSTRIFQAKRDNYMGGSGETKLIASRILGRDKDTFNPTTPVSTSKVAATSSKRGPQTKNASRKKIRHDAD